MGIQVAQYHYIRQVDPAKWRVDNFPGFNIKVFSKQTGSRALTLNPAVKWVRLSI